MPASFKEICEAFELVSMTGGSGEQEAYLCKQTGKIYWHSDLADPDDELYEKLPDDIEDDEKYIAIPDKRELDLGKPLVCWTLRANSCRRTSMTFGACSARRAATGNSGPCWNGEGRSIAGMNSNRRQRSERCATGARSIP